MDKPNSLVEDLPLVKAHHLHLIYFRLAWTPHCIYQIDEQDDIYPCQPIDEEVEKMNMI